MTFIRTRVPVLCLAEASTTTEELAGVMVLARHDRAAITPLPADDWFDLLNLSVLVGRVDCAATFLGATQQRAYVLTAMPARYPGSDMTIDVGHPL